MLKKDLIIKIDALEVEKKALLETVNRTTEDRKILLAVIEDKQRKLDQSKLNNDSLAHRLHLLEVKKQINKKVKDDGTI